MYERHPEPGSPESKVSPETLRLFKNFVEARTPQVHGLETKGGATTHRVISEGVSAVSGTEQLIPIDSIEYHYSRYFDAHGNEVIDDEQDYTISIGLGGSEYFGMYVRGGVGIAYHVGENLSIEADDDLVCSLIRDIETKEAAKLISPAE